MKLHILQEKRTRGDGERGTVGAAAREGARGPTGGRMGARETQEPLTNGARRGQWYAS